VQQLKAPADDYFCFTFLEGGDYFGRKFVPWDPRKVLGLDNEKPDMCPGR
jgi:hypothetical protein